MSATQHTDLPWVSFGSNHGGKLWNEWTVYYSFAVSVVRVVVMLLHYKSAARAENNFKMAPWVCPGSLNKSMSDPSDSGW